MEKALQKSEAKAVENKEDANKSAIEKTRQFLKKSTFQADCDPDLIFKKAGDQLIDLVSKDKKKSKKAQKALQEITEKGMMAWGLETHYAIAETVDPRFRPLVIEVARQIEKEYDCKTTSELVLVDAIAGAYGRMIEFSRKLDNSTRLEYLSTEKNGYYTLIGKEVDRAHRQLMASLAMLKQMKNPTFEVNVKAKTAFIAQNQQINTETYQNPPISEINDSR